MSTPRDLVVGALGLAGALGLGVAAYHTAEVDLPEAVRTQLARSLGLERAAVHLGRVRIDAHGLEIDGLAAGQLSARSVRLRPALTMLVGGRAAGTITVEELRVEDPPLERVDELRVDRAELSTMGTGARVHAHGVVAELVPPGAGTTRLPIRIAEVGAELEREGARGLRPRRIAFTGLGVGPFDGLAGGVYLHEESIELRAAAPALRLSGHATAAGVDATLELTRDLLVGDERSPWLRRLGIDHARATVSGRMSAHAPRALLGGVAHVRAELQLESAELAMPRIAPTPIALRALSVSAHGELGGGVASTLRLTTGKATLDATLRLDDDEHDDAEDAEGADEPAHILSVELALPRIDCASLLAAVPAALRPALDGMALAGELAGAVHLALPLESPARLELDGDVELGCTVTSEPPLADASRLRDEAPLLPGARDEAGRQRRFELGPANPSFRALDRIPELVTSTFLEAEDGRFYKHRGLDLSQIRRALAHDVEVGAPGRGGSTITQQVAKNLFLSGERTLGRKLEETVLAWRLEDQLGKRRILELYLNLVELGPGTYGVAEGARRWFGKDLAALTPVETASLAALLPAPRRGMDEAFQRRRDQLLARLPAAPTRRLASLQP